MALASGASDLMVVVAVAPVALWAGAGTTVTVVVTWLLVMGLLASGDLSILPVAAPVCSPNFPCRGRARVVWGGEFGREVGGVGGRRAGWEGLVANTTDIV